MYPISKRVLDVCVSASCILLLWPLFLLIAVAIKLDSIGPIFFVQNAIGRNGKVFKLLKFRSMRPGSQDDRHKVSLRHNYFAAKATSHDVDGRPIFKMAMTDTSRITRVGTILRRSSFDELPQFFNVLTGDMSLVGPRPALPFEIELYDEMERQRLAVKPGMTGLYQVTARNRVDVRQMIRIDLEYVSKRSLLFDCILLLRTPRVMFNGI